MNWFAILPEVKGLDNAIVVDGGGTHSRAAVVHSDGTLWAYTEGGPTSGRAVGNETALANLIGVIAAAVDAAGTNPSNLDYCLITSAAIDTKQHSSFMSAGVSASLGLHCPVVAVPDTLGCWAITNTVNAAVAVIAGTGSVVLAGDISAGLCYRIGGWDFLLGDEGSGFGIGRAALRETMRVGENRSSAGRLADQLLARLGISHPDELPDRVTKHIDKALVASMAEDVLTLASEGDSVAGQIVSEQVGTLVEQVHEAASRIRTGRRPVHIGQFGGLFESTYYASTFRDMIARKVGEDVELSTPTSGAISGAWALILRHAGTPLDGVPEQVRRLTAELTRMSAQPRQ